MGFVKKIENASQEKENCQRIYQKCNLPGLHPEINRRPERFLTIDNGLDPLFITEVEDLGHCKKHYGAPRE